MSRGRLAALALVALSAAGGAHTALAQDGDAPRERETTSRMWTEGGYRGIWSVRVSRVSDSSVRVRAGAILEQPQRLDGVVRIRCITPEREYVCFQELPLAVQAGTRTRRRCTTRVVRERQRRRRVRRCRNVQVPNEAAIRTTVTAAHADGSPARIFELMAYYVAADGTIVSTSGALGVPD